MNRNPTGLEAFVEQHRADFDAFEPRPDLWDDLELALDAPAAPGPAPLHLTPDYSTPNATPETQWRYGWAAAVAALLVAGSGYFWQTNKATPPTWAARTATTAESAPEGSDFSLYTGSAPVAMATANASGRRLGTAVERMETYYATQIQERQEDLHQMEQASTVATDADWRQEMAALDSTYRQLKVELYRNPEPDVVLDAMNRNLQIRLDILNQQLRTREQVQAYDEPYAVANTHRKR